MGYNDVGFREWASSSNYHSLQVTANRRFARGLQFGLSWTWSKAMDFADSDTADVSTLVPIRAWNYGMASLRPHARFEGQLAVGHSGRAVADNRWRRRCSHAGSVRHRQLRQRRSRWASGSRPPTDIDITGSPTDGARWCAGEPRPAQERAHLQPLSSIRTRSARPAVGTFGNAAKNVFRGPGINNWDLVALQELPAPRSRRGCSSAGNSTTPSTIRSSATWTTARGSTPRATRPTSVSAN